MNMDSETDYDAIYQPYSYLTVHPWLVRRTHWYVGRRSPGDASINFPPETRIWPRQQYGIEQIYRLRQFFTATETEELLAYLKTVPDHHQTSILAITDEQQIDYRLLGPRHPFFDGVLNLNKTPDCPLQFQVRGVCDWFLIHETAAEVNSDAQAANLIRQQAEPGDAQRIRQPGPALNWNQPFEVHWNPLIHISGKAFNWFCHEPMYAVAQECIEGLKHYLSRQLEALQAQRQSVDLHNIWVAHTLGLGDDDVYLNHYVTYVNLAFRGTQNSAGAQLVEAVVWLRLVEEIGYLPLFERFGPLFLLPEPVSLLPSTSTPASAAG